MDLSCFFGTDVSTIHYTLLHTLEVYYSAIMITSICENEKYLKKFKIAIEVNISPIKCCTLTVVNMPSHNELLPEPCLFSLRMNKIKVDIFQATRLWPSLSSCTRPTERNESSKCWTSSSVLPGTIITRRVVAAEPEGSTLLPAARPPMPCCGRTSCPAETFIAWVRGCRCGEFDQCTAGVRYYV